MTEEKKKREFHPSSLAYLQVCPRFKNDYSRDSSHADRGTKLHALMASGEKDLSQLPVEDREAILACRGYLKSRQNALTADHVLTKEVPLRGSLNREVDLLGTADVLIVEKDAHYAEIIDWKFGQGAVLPAKQNPQTMSYAYMAFQANPQLRQIVTTLVCPLQEEALIDSHNWDRADLPSIKTVLDSITLRVMDEKAEPVLNWSVCRYCGAKAGCPAMAEVMLRKSEVVTPATVLGLLSARDLSPDVRGKWQQVAEWADDWAKQVKRANLDAVLTDGEGIDGYSVVRRKGSTKVDNTALAVEKLVSVGYDRNLVMAACALSIPSLTSGLENVPPEQRGGGEKGDIRETIEALLQDHLKEGEPVIYLKRSKAKKQKVKEIE